MLKPVDGFTRPTGAALMPNQERVLQALVGRPDGEGVTYSEWRKRVSIPESSFDAVGL